MAGRSPVVEALPEFVAGRRSRARLVQRLPDPLRGRAAARRAHAQRVPAVPVSVDAPASSTTRRRRSRARCGPGQVLDDADLARRGQVPRRRRDAAQRCAQQQPDRVPLRDGRGPGDARRESQRLAREHRGHRERGGHGARADAAPRARGRGGPGRYRRAADLPVAPRQPRRGRHVPRSARAWPERPSRRSRSTSRAASGSRPTSTTASSSGSAASPPTPSSASSPRCGPSTARTSTRASSSSGCPRPAARVLQGPGRERRRHRHRRRLGGGVQDREPQPPLVHRAVPGRGHRGGRHPARHLHDGRAPDRDPRLAALRRSRRSAGRGTSSSGVVSGISWYGNCFGCPTVGGEIAFAPEYAGNPLVNVMCVGLVRADRIFRARAEGIGNPVFYVGNKTGPRRHPRRHHGLGHLRRARRGAAARPCRWAIRSPRSCCWRRAWRRWPPAPWSGIQDMGAAGLACCTSEMPARSGTGMDVELSAVPAARGGHDALRAAALGVAGAHAARRRARARGGGARASSRKWELDAVQIGSVTAGRDAGRAPPGRRGGAGARRRRWPRRRATRSPSRRPPGWPSAAPSTRSTLPEPGRLRRGPARRSWPRRRIASKEWAFRQYDQQVGINTLVLPGSDAAVLRVKGTRRAHRRRHRRQRPAGVPRSRGAAPPWPCARPRATSPAPAARPLGVTDCLNFGSPERPEILWQFAEAVEGIAEACRALELPVVGGNVSLYNETRRPGRSCPRRSSAWSGSWTTRRCCATQWFKAAGHRMALLGPDDGEPRRLASICGHATIRLAGGWRRWISRSSGGCRRRCGRRSGPGWRPPRTTARRAGWPWRWPRRA